MTTTIQITPDRVIFSGGKFDSEYFYIRSGIVGEFRMPLNFTMSVQLYNSGNFRQHAQFSYSSVTYSHQHFGDGPAFTFNPETALVKFT